MCLSLALCTHSSDPVQIQKLENWPPGSAGGARLGYWKKEREKSEKKSVKERVIGIYR